MKYEKTIEIPREELDRIERMFDWDKEDLLAKNLPLNSTLQTWTGKFEDGIEIDVKLNSSDYDCWSEAVVFDKEGRQITFCDPSYQIEGGWIFRLSNGDEYSLTIKGV